MPLQNSFSASPNKASFWALDALEDAQDSQSAWMTEEANDVSSAPSSPKMKCPLPTTSGIIETHPPPTDKVLEGSTASCTDDDQETDPLNSTALDIFESSLNTSASDDDFGDFQDAPFDPFAQPIFTSDPNDSHNSNEPLLQAPVQVPEPLIFSAMGLVQAAYARFDASTRALRRTGKSSKGRRLGQVAKNTGEEGFGGILFDEVGEEQVWQGRFVNGVGKPVSFAKTSMVKCRKRTM